MLGELRHTPPCFALQELELTRVVAEARTSLGTLGTRTHTVRRRRLCRRAEHTHFLRATTRQPGITHAACMTLATGAAALIHTFQVLTLIVAVAQRRHRATLAIETAGRRVLRQRVQTEA